MHAVIMLSPSSPKPRKIGMGVPYILGLLERGCQKLGVPIFCDTGLVQLRSTVLALPPRPNQLLRAHTQTTPAALKRSAPNEVRHVYVSVNS